MTRLPPLFKYFGSKYTLAPRYPAPKHDTVVEPFAGSASYASLYAHRNVILCETNTTAYSAWDWLINRATPDSIMQLPGDDMPEGARIDDLVADYGAASVVTMCQRVGAHYTRTVSKWNGTPGLWGDRWRARLASNVHRIKHWRVLNVNGLEYMERATEPATWFVDPPYQAHPKGRYKTAPLDYERLADACRSVPGQVIVCESAHDGVQPSWLPFEPFHVNTGGGPRPGSRAKNLELIWTRE